MSRRRVGERVGGCVGPPHRPLASILMIYYNTLCTLRVGAATVPRVSAPGVASGSARRGSHGASLLVSAGSTAASGGSATGGPRWTAAPQVPRADETGRFAPPRSSDAGGGAAGAEGRPGKQAAVWSHRPDERNGAAAAGDAGHTPSRDSDDDDDDEQGRPSGQYHDRFMDGDVTAGGSRGVAQPLRRGDMVGEADRRANNAASEREAALRVDGNGEWDGVKQDPPADAEQTFLDEGRRFRWDFGDSERKKLLLVSSGNEGGVVLGADGAHRHQELVAAPASWLICGSATFYPPCTTSSTQPTTVCTRHERRTGVAVHRRNGAAVVEVACATKPACDARPPRVAAGRVRDVGVLLLAGCRRRFGVADCRTRSKAHTKGHEDAVRVWRWCQVARRCAGCAVAPVCPPPVLPVLRAGPPACQWLCCRATPCLM